MAAMMSSSQARSISVTRLMRPLYPTVLAAKIFFNSARLTGGIEEKQGQGCSKIFLKTGSIFRAILKPALQNESSTCWRLSANARPDGVVSTAEMPRIYRDIRDKRNTTLRLRFSIV